MRLVRLSRTFNGELVELLSQGIPRFGARVVADKQALVFGTIENYLVHFPMRPIDPVLGLCACRVDKTPFVLLYDYDDAELRVHLVIHESADRALVDLAAVVW